MTESSTKASAQVAGGTAAGTAAAAESPDLSTVLSVRSRPKPPGPLSASLTHIWRQLISFLHFPTQMIDVVVLPFIFLLMFTYIFGGALAGSTKDYLHFFLPGLLVQSVVMMTMYTGAALNTDVNRGIFDRFRTLPFWQPASIVGNLVGDSVRYVLAITLTIGMGLVLGFRADGGVMGVVWTLLLLLFFAFSISWIFAMLGLIVSTPESITGTSMLVMFPLVFTSNIFVPTDTMPGWMQVVVDLNPVSHAATAARGLMHGNATAGQVITVLVTSTVLTAVFGAITLRLYRTKNAR
ncbi:ABC transporter permease [Spirillospora sp. NPDC047279]|uniref:ABC transporter permease n=1 Tax=Spirillospora sp. NPDC047279 TaxID=3155478 RepID=UPI0033F1E41B